jgi:hypothetical protein
LSQITLLYLNFAHSVGRTLALRKLGICWFYEAIYSLDIGLQTPAHTKIVR